MHVGIASEWVGEDVGGLERYAVQLVRALGRIASSDRYSIFLTPRGVRAARPLETASVSLVSTGVSSRWHYVALGLPLAVARERVDVLHATFSFVPWCPSRRLVFTVHDLCADVHPEYFPPLVRRRVSWLTARGVARADRVIVPTGFIRDQLVDRYPEAKGKVSVIPWGVGYGDPDIDPPDAPGSSEAKLELPREYVLYVGRFHARKNLERLVEAFSILKRRGKSDAGLVLVGRDLWHGERVMERVRELGLSEDVLCPGHVSDEELGRIYRGASVFAFPSLYEGFGMPPLEAMVRGVPVMAADLHCMPENLGAAALLVDPYSPEAMADALERLLGDAALRERLSALGRERAARYSWEANARATLDLYREAASVAPGDGNT